MKKVLFVLLTFIVCITIVSADEIKEINLKWSEEVVYFKEERIIGNYYYFITSDGIMKIDSMNGQIVKRINISDFFDFYFNNNELFVFSKDNDTSKYKYQILDLDFNLKSEKSLDMNSIIYYEKTNNQIKFIGSAMRQSNGANYFVLIYLVLDNNFNVIAHKEHPIDSNITSSYYEEDTGVFWFRNISYLYTNAYKFDGDFTTVNQSDVPLGLPNISLNSIISSLDDTEKQDNISDEIRNEIENMIPLKYSDTRMKSIIKKDGNNYVAMLQEEKTGSTSTDKIIYYKKTVLYLDSNLNIIWTMEFPEIQTDYFYRDKPYETSAVLAVKNGHILIATNETPEPTIKIFNRNKTEELDLIEQLGFTNNDTPNYAIFTKTGLFLVYSKYVEDNDHISNNTQGKLIPMFLSNIPSYTAASQGKESKSKIYYLDVSYYVHTKVVSGEGEVKVNKTYLDSDEVVEFEVLPKEGYVLGEIKVIDADGNVIIFNDYKFTMPSSDVTIEVTFVKAAVNPNTKTFAIGAMVLIGIASFGALYYLNKKKKYLQ